MKRLTITLLCALGLLLNVFAAPTKAEKEAAAKAAQEQKANAWRADQIARKKAILNFKTVFVEGGTFMMGCTEEQESECFKPERPAHPVFVGSFAICKYCVSQRQWKEVIARIQAKYKMTTLL